MEYGAAVVLVLGRKHVSGGASRALRGRFTEGTSLVLLSVVKVQLKLILNLLVY